MSMAKVKAEKTVAVVGAGHNGLTCAAYLSKAGFKVSLFEKRGLVGGLCVNERPFESAPDIVLSSVACYYGMLRSEVVAELDLTAHGLKPYLTDPVEVVLLDNGQYVFTPRDGSEAKSRIAGLDQKQQEGWQNFWYDIQKAASIVYPHYLRAGLSQAHLVELLRQAGLNILADHVFSGSLFELLGHYVGNEHLQAVAATCTPGFAASVGSVFGCIHHGTASTCGEFGAWGQVYGGMGEITAALRSVAMDHGTQIFLNKPVQEILLKDNQARALRFEDGSQQEFDIVVSALDPYVLFEKLLPSGSSGQSPAQSHLGEIRQYLSANRPRVSAAKLHFLLRELPVFTTLAEIGHNHKGVIVIAPAKAAVERAAVAVPQGRMPDELMVTMAFPCLEDPSMRTDGGYVGQTSAGSSAQVLTVDVHYLPASINGRAWSEADDQLLVEETIRTIEKQCPGIRDLILETFVVSPRALAERYNLDSLSCWHLPMLPEHLFEKRTLPGCGHYETPLNNLYVCSAGSYPGGNVTAAPGHNLAKMLIEKYAPAVQVFAATAADVERSAEIAAMYEAALGPGGVQKAGHEAYPDSDLFSEEGVGNTLIAGERLLAVAQVEEQGRPQIVAAMVADRLSPHHVEFNSMAVPVGRRGRKLGSHIVRGLVEIIEQDKFTVNCTELVTHSLASQAAHLGNGFSALCGFGYCHYPHVFFADHPESVLWVSRLHGKLVPLARRLRKAMGGNSAQSSTDSLFLGRFTGDAGLDQESIDLLGEILRRRTAYVPECYQPLVSAILAQFEDILDCPVADGTSASGDWPFGLVSSPGKDVCRPEQQLQVEIKEGFGHSYIIFQNNFCFDEAELAAALRMVDKLGKRYIKVSIPANTPEAVKVAEYLRERGFVFHSYLPLYGFDRDQGDRHRAVFYDVLSLQWIKPSVVAANPLPGETGSVIKIYGYPQNLSGAIIGTIASDLEAVQWRSRTAAAVS